MPAIGRGVSVDCTACGRSNRDIARFCGGCGASLLPRCAKCGNESAPGARFCDACGAPLAAGPAAAEARKVVSIVFADLIGSTALHERLDAEAARAFMERYYDAMRGAVAAERGKVTQLLGDGVKAVFGAPRVAEDDALRAVRAAAGMQRAFRALADAQREAVGAVGLRVAVNSGEVVAQDESEIIGDPVNVAAHLQAQARDGDVLLGDSTARLVARQVTLEPFGSFTLKGRAEPVTAWRVVSLERPPGAPALAFVGRDEELRRIRAVYELALAERRAQLAVIVGSPGLGKSRLLSELAHRLGHGASVLAARCDATGGATFAPLAEALRARLGLEAVVDRESVRAALQRAVRGEPGERERLADGLAALLQGAPASPEETFFVLRRLLAALAAERPVVLLIDDLHWAEPLLLDFVEHLVRWSSDVPLLVLAGARPELRDRRSSLATAGPLVAEVLALGGLDAGAAARLAANAIGADELPAAIAGRVLAASEGNPLFVGELVRMLVQDGALVREGDRWTTRGSLADLEMPPTIQALLAARIERLRPEEREVLERAAVIGRHFSRAALAELLPAERRGELDLRLEALRRSELIEPDTGWLLGEPVLRFHHALIRDAAYRRLLKQTRAELHARFADWLAARVGDAPEHDEMLGWHLEQAHALQGELGPPDARSRALGERAAGHLAAAGRRALARDDLSLAAGLLGRALERLAADSPARAELALDWCETLLAAGDVGPAERALDELGRLAGAAGRLRAWHVCFSAHLAALTDPQALGDSADAVAAAAQQLAAAGDAAGEAKAHSVRALVLSRLGRIGACEGALDLALAAARRGGDRRRSNAVLAGAPLAALWGPSPVTRASGRCLDVVRVLRITQGAPAVEAVALRCQGVLEALRGRADAARRMVAASRRLVEELGITQRLLEAELFAGRIELLEGDFAAAERCLRTAYGGLRAQGLDIDAAQAAALLGRALLELGRGEEALALSRESEQLAGDDRIAGIAWHCLRAEALAQRGETAAAVEIAGQAVALGAATDALLDHADARMALATALRAAGRMSEADAEEAHAVSLWEAKGASSLVERARAAARTAPAVPAERQQPARARSEAPTPARPQSPRRVRPNAASAFATRLDAAVAAKDASALRALFADGMQVVHHPTDTRFGREGALARFDALIRAEGLRLCHEPVATLGDSLVLCRAVTSVRALAEDDVAPAGAIESDTSVVIEVDALGRECRVEIFAGDRLGAALACLYELRAVQLPEGAERARAANAARGVAALLGRLDLERCAAVIAADVEAVDHRRVGFGSGKGAAALLRALASGLEVSDALDGRLDDVIAATPDGVLARWTSSGRERDGGGRFEWPFLRLCVFGADGLLARYEIFDPEREADALARFDALVGAAPAARQQETGRRAALTRAFSEAFAARDWDALAALLAPDLAVSDHRRLGWEPLHGPQAYIDALRSLVELAPDVRLRVDHAETSGPGYLYLTSWHGSREGGAFEEPSWIVCELDASGRIRRFDQYDLEQQAAARARLAAIGAGAAADPLQIPPNAATRAVRRFEVCVAARDWQALVDLHAPDFVYEDRRPLVRDSGDREKLVASVRLSAGAGARASQTLLATAGECLALSRETFTVVRGSALVSEIEVLMLFEVGADGRFVSAVTFDAGDREAADVELRARSAARPR
jgi:class 3 adenylate cyclase/ketosteroid isomerase-like protein